MMGVVTGVARVLRSVVAVLVRLAMALALALPLALVLAACGGGPPSAPTGIDELVVPTPSPRPQDYVTEIDNPWLAWEPGASTTYVVSGGAVPGGAPASGQARQQISATTTQVAGLPATTMTTTTADGGTSSDWFAQDLRGNVWWLGRAGEWTAGVDGARAGLWMPAAPRIGDGFRPGLAPGVVDDIASVESAPPADAGSAGDEVRLETRTDLVPGRVEVRTYVEGTGLTSYAVAGVVGTPDTIWTRAD